MSFPRYALAAGLALFPLPAFAQMDMPGMDISPSAPSDSHWQIHSHTVLNLVADNQEGLRGGSKTFFAGMTMLSASRNFGANNRLELSAMLSPDPLMGQSGYPLLLQSGETADGVRHLVDRQHPHDLIMGLSARLTHSFANGSAFIEAGYPGEVAFGPVAFMHRASGETFPTAPITHHWLDSGHITMGLITAGVAKGPLTFEVTRFTGREPDQNRYNLDAVHLDSTAARVTWRISDELTAQASWAHQVSPEQLEPDVDLDKTSLSLAWGHDFALGRLDSTLAWGRKQLAHSSDSPSDGYLFENTFRFNGPWLALARYEHTYNEELALQPYAVAKTEIGVVRTFTLSDNATLGLGLVRQFNSLPAGLKPAYGNHANGNIAFLQLRLHAMKM